MISYKFRISITLQHHLRFLIQLHLTMAIHLFILWLALSALSSSGSASVFESIDCGSNDFYTDANLITWTSDDTKNGKAQVVQATNSVSTVMDSLRVFESRNKNCYNVAVDKGEKILVRASFFYGNYDKKSSPPSFDLHFDGNFWTTVETSSTEVKVYEVTYVPNGEVTSVCVAQTKPNQFPFMSALEVRGLGSDMYSHVDPGYALFGKITVAYGASSVVRFASDAYDRMWIPATDGHTAVVSDALVIDTTTIPDDPPQAVLLNAITSSATSDLDLVTDFPSTQVPIYITMYFSEVTVLDTTEKRSFQIYKDGKPISDPILPPYGGVIEMYITNMTASSDTKFSLVATSDSDHPPIINAMEVFYVSENKLTDGTNSDDGVPVCDTCKTFCGAYGKCNISNGCECLNGFEPKNPKEWQMADWSNGCVWKTQLDCVENCDYITQRYIQLPDTLNASITENMSLEECNTRCLKDIWCTAYAVRDTKDGGPGCFLWFGDLVGIGECKTNGQDVFVKVPSLPSKKVPAGLWKKVVPAFVAAFFVLAIGLSVIIWTKKKRELRNGRIATNFQPDATNENRAWDSDLKIFDFFTVANATNNFSTDNKIGEGGFGPVYKGVLEDGQEIAIKKLARYSEQGNHEFMNEVIYIAKLQHRNLVKLLGYCLHGAEKMLIYEYLLHKSLDLFLFDPEQSMVLDWSKRLDIIKGIARGLLYLHQDSRLRIIHRDLKASNVLLDYGMNPKISDFGTARSFREQDSEGITKRVVGTYGYIAPEYAMHGLFSVKSDVFSYGVLVLEIVCGKTNRRFHHPEHRLNLIGHAWNLFQEGRQMELIDSSIEAASDWTEVLRAVHVGLLCVQQCPEDRPNMASVVHMLEGGSALVQPEQPGFYDERNLVVLLEASLGETSSVQHEDCSVNMVSITQVEGR